MTSVPTLHVFSEFMPESYNKSKQHIFGNLVLFGLLCLTGPKI